jgi:hypothetical protein
MEFSTGRKFELNLVGENAVDLNPGKILGQEAANEKRKPKKEQAPNIGRPDRNRAMSQS